MPKQKVLIMGAAGRDFHNFNVYFRGKTEYEVVAFTATQIPHISGRVYPAALAGDLYPNGIPIFGENELEDLVRRHGIDLVVFSYSDIPHLEVMHKASRAISAGGDFLLLGARSTCSISRVTQAGGWPCRFMGRQRLHGRYPACRASCGVAKNSTFRR